MAEVVPSKNNRGFFSTPKMALQESSTTRTLHKRTEMHSSTEEFALYHLPSVVYKGNINLFKTFVIIRLTIVHERSSPSTIYYMNTSFLEFGTYKLRTETYGNSRFVDCSHRGQVG